MISFPACRANILLDAFLNAKVGDFGLARLGPQDANKSHTVTANIIGSTPYMPPEYLKSGKVSVKMDAYSYGVVSLKWRHLVTYERDTWLTFVEDLYWTFSKKENTCFFT